MHSTWNSLSTNVLLAHEGHGREHDAFAVAIGAGVVVDVARQARRRQVGPPVLMRAARFLSSAGGLLALTFTFLNVLLRLGLRCLDYSPLVFRYKNEDVGIGQRARS